MLALLQRPGAPRAEAQARHAHTRSAARQERAISSWMVFRRWTRGAAELSERYLHAREASFPSDWLPDGGIAHRNRFGEGR